MAHKSHIDSWIWKCVAAILIWLSLAPVCMAAAKPAPAIPQKAESAAAITVKNHDYSTVIRFPASKDVKAASYIRGKQLWVVFDKPLSLQLPDLPQVKADDIYTKPTSWLRVVNEQKIDASYSCFVLELNELRVYTPVIYMLHEQDSWSVVISSDATTSQFPRMREIRVSAKPDALVPNVEISVGNVFSPLQFKDPRTGKNMTVIPLLEDKVLIPEEYRFVDFNVLRSIQGVAIEGHSDNINIENRGIKAYVASSGGLNIAPKVYTSHKPMEEIDGSQSVGSVLSYDRQILQLRPFMIKDDEFVKKLKLLQRQLYDPNKDAKETHLNLALLYIANNFFKEALAIIADLENINQEYARHFDLALIKAVASFLAHDTQDACDAISQISIADVPVHLRREVRLWHELIEYANGIDENIVIGSSIVQLVSQYNDDFLSGYNPHVLTEIALLVFDNRIKYHDLDGAKDINEMLNNIKDSMSSHQQNRLLYEIGQYYQVKQDFDNAAKAWDSCADDLSDTQNRAQCRFAKAQMLHQNSKLTDQEYIDELERIAVTWRGDATERHMMNELGNLYYKQQDSLHALRAWQAVTLYHSNTGDALLLAQRMSDTFVDFFLQSEGLKIEPFQAVSLFYEFQNLIPLGDIGDELIIKLTAYLIDLDLLNNAIALLNHLVDNRLHGVRKEEIINRLARAYITDGLPFSALEAIAKGDEYELLPDHIATSRKQIHARALVKMGENEAVEKLLQNDLSHAADDIRADLYWEQGNWHKFSQNSEPYLYSIRKNSDDLSDEAVVRVMQQTLAYMMMGQDELLSGLYKDFYHRIPRNNRYSQIMALLANLWQVRAPMDGAQSVDELRQLINKLSEDLR